MAAPVRVASNAACASSLPRRQPGKLLHDDVEVVLDRVEVAARLIDLSQRKSEFIPHAHGMQESGY
jgi:hypothetical protein